jgi:hypothetical protein
MTDPKTPLDRALRRAATLAHDVGKYVARTARNLPEPLADPLGPALVAMLVRDLYALGDGERASARFDRLVAAAGPCDPPDRPDDARLGEARRLLAEVDALEPAVRAGEVAAVARAATLAREVERLLRGLAQAARSAS